MGAEILIIYSDLCFLVLFIAGIGKKLYICGVNWHENLPIEWKYGVYIS